MRIALLVLATGAVLGTLLYGLKDRPIDSFPAGVALGEDVADRSLPEALLEGASYAARPADGGGLTLLPARTSALAPPTTLVRVRLLRVDEARSASCVLLVLRGEGAIAGGAGSSLPPDSLDLGLRDEARIPAAARDWLVLRGSGVSPVACEIDAAMLATGEVELPVEPLRPLLGRVVDTEIGRPIGGARVRTERRRVSSPLPIEVAAVLDAAQEVADITDEEGRFELELPDLGGLVLHCSAAGYCSVECVEVRPDGRPLLVALEPAVATSGCVVDVDGRPVAGAEISIGRIGALPLEERVAAHTDHAGTFRIAELPRAPMAIVARADGFAPTRREVDLRDPRQRASTLVLPPSLPLTGVVVDEGGGPVPGVSVVVGSLTDHFVVGSTVTDGEGRFEVVETCAGAEYHVELEADGFDPADVGPLRVGSESTRFTLAVRGRIALQLRDEEGAPIRSARIARAPEVAAEVHDEYWWSAAPWTASESQEGRHELDGLRRLPHRFLIEAEGFRPAVVRATPSHPAADPPGIAVTLERGVPFAGTLVDCRGDAVAGAEVRLAARASFGSLRTLPETSPVVTDGAGGFVLARVPPRPFDLVVAHPVFGTTSFRAVAPARSGATLHWPVTGSLRGRIRVGDRARLGSLCVIAEPEGVGAVAEARPDLDGGFTIDRLPLGSHRIRLIDEWASTTWHTFATRERDVEITAEGPAVVEFDLTAAVTLEGRLAIPPSVAAERFEVVATRLEPERAERITSPVELAGRFVLCDLAPGRWRVRAASRSAGWLASAAAEVSIWADLPAPRLDLAVADELLELQLLDATTRAPPVAGSIERLDRSGRCRDRVEADSAGRVRLALAPHEASATLVARAPGFAAATIDLAAAEPRPVQIVMVPESRLELALEAADPRLVARARVTLEAGGHAIERPAAAALTFAELGPGPIRLHVRSAELRASWSGRLAAGETRALRLELAPPARVTIRVRDADGAPAPGRTVTISYDEDADAPLLHLESDGSGAVVASLAAGRATVRCEGAEQRLEIAAGASHGVALQLR